MKTVSIHIVTYNSERWIRDCLQSVFQQSYPIEQVIIVDNASTDRTLSIIAEFANQVQLIANESNTGFAAGHNLAIQRSASDCYLMLNPDVILQPDYIRYLVLALERGQDLGSCTGKLVRKANPDIIDSTGLHMFPNRRCVDRGANESAQMWNASGEIFGVSAAAALYSREMVADISVDGAFFDEQFFAYKEDVDVAWRAQLFGWKAMYVAEAIALHERGWKEGERWQRPLFVRQYSYINRYRLIVKNDSPRYMLKYAFPLFIFELASHIYYLWKDPQVMFAWKKFWSDWRDLRQQRIAVKQKRTNEWQNIYQWFRKR